MRKAKPIVNPVQPTLTLESLKAELDDAGILKELELRQREEAALAEVEADRCNQQDCISEELFILLLKKRDLLHGDQSEAMFRAIAKHIDPMAIVELYTETQDQT